MKCMQFVIFILVSIGQSLTTHAAARTTTKEMPCSAPTTAQTAARTVLYKVSTKISAINTLLQQEHPTDIRHEIIRILVQEVGINPNLLKHPGSRSTVIYDAVKHSNEKLTQLLITAGADVNQRGSNYDVAPVCFAQTVPIAQLLLAAGADAQVADCDGGSLLHNVVRTGKNADLIPLYVSAGTVTDLIPRPIFNYSNRSEYGLEYTRRTPIIMLLTACFHYYWNERTNSPYNSDATIQIVRNLVLAGPHFSFETGFSSDPGSAVYWGKNLAKILIERINEKITQEKKAFLRILQREIVTTAREKRRLLLESTAHLPIKDVANGSHHDVPELITEYSDCSTEDFATFDEAEKKYAEHSSNEIRMTMDHPYFNPLSWPTSQALF